MRRPAHALPGTPQIQNIIPTSFFGTNAWAAPWLGLIGSLFIICFGLLWLERQRRKALNNNEGYGTDLKNEPETPDNINRLMLSGVSGSFFRSVP